MKFAFFAGSNCVAIHALSLKERPLGGTETGVIHVAAELAQRGHEVTVFTSHLNPPKSNPLYRPLAEIESHGPVDVFVSVRDWIPLFYKIEAKKKFLWTGDSYDQLANFGIGDKRISSKMDGVFAVSDWQADQLSQKSGMDRSQFFVIKNGIDPQLFQGQEVRNPFRLIYSSTPYRGLEYIPALLKELSKDFPQVEISVFSGYSVYGQSEDAFQNLKAQLEQTPKVKIHGNVLQKDLAREMMKSSILFYPNQFEETSCMTAIEAMAAGAVVLSSQLGALQETVGDAGILIEGHPSQPNYQKKFLDSARKLLSDSQLISGLREKGQKRAQELSWSKACDRLLAATQL